MSQKQVSAVTLARSIINGDVEVITSDELGLLNQAGGIENPLPLMVTAHKVIRAYAQRRGFFSFANAA